jgi:hypothetical protein
MTNAKGLKRKIVVIKSRSKRRTRTDCTVQYEKSVMPMVLSHIPETGYSEAVSFFEVSAKLHLSNE